jgi:catechol 2,3-dioxygenase-like lactoylglutathione lyase family enzyme
MSMKVTDLKKTLGIKRIHHVGILTADIEAAVESYALLLTNRPPRIVDVARPAVRLRSAMIPVGEGSGTHVQLIQPVEGPGVDELEKGGEGVIYEVAFEVADIAAANTAARQAGEFPTDLAGDTFEGPYLTAGSGSRYFYLQPTAQRGTRLELIEVVT